MMNRLLDKLRALLPENELDERDRLEHELDHRALMRARWRTWGGVFVIGHLLQAIVAWTLDPREVDPVWRFGLVAIHFALSCIDGVLLASTLWPRGPLQWLSDRVGPSLQAIGVIAFALLSVNAQRTHGSLGMFASVVVATPFAFRATTKHFAIVVIVATTLLIAGVMALQPSPSARVANISMALGLCVFSIGAARVYNQSLVRERKARNALRDFNDRLAFEVAEKTAQIRALANRLDAALEDERRRLAQDLHDDLGQELVAIRLDLVSLRKKLEGAGQDSVMERMSDALERSNASVRGILESLRPRIFDEEGLEAAAHWLIERFAERVGCAVSTRVELYDEPHTSVGLVAFRVIQESLANIARHARATAVTLSLEGGDRDVTIEVRDNGESPAPIQPGRGLRGMRERVEALGGSLSIARDRANAQTVVRVTLPANPPTVAVTPWSPLAPSQ